MKRVTTIVLLLALLGAACGGSEDDSVGQPSVDGESSAAPTDSSGDDSAATGSDVAVVDLNLSTAPIPYQSTFVDAWPGGASPQVDECSLLDGATIAAAMKNPDEVTLDRATSTSCDWVVFPVGFSVVVEPASEVDVDDHSGRAYNIDVEPVVKPQDGPGEKAVLLVDTVAADGFEYAYFFVLDDRAVTIRSTAVPIAGVEAWRTMADEVAANLASGAAAPTGDADSEADPCGFFTTADAASLLMTTPEEVTFFTDPTGRSCQWEAGEYGALAVRFYSAADVDEYVGSFDAKLAEDGRDRSDELGVTAVSVLGGTYLYSDTFDGAMYLRLEPVESGNSVGLEAAAAQNLVGRVS